MTWALVILLAIAALLLTLWLVRKPRSGREAIAAALLLGIAGYAAQSHPSLPGSPTAPREKVDAEAAKGQPLAEVPQGGDKGLVIANAMARNGEYANAATILRGSVERDPNNADAWLAMANALVSHADGQLSPAALLAFRRAEAAAPANPGPPFFLGLALAQSGRLQEGRATWVDLLARTPPDAPWRADLTDKLRQLDQFIAEQGARQGQPPRP